MPYQIYALLIIVFVIIGIMIFLSFVPIGLWITAFFSGVKIRLSIPVEIGEVLIFGKEIKADERT